MTRRAAAALLLGQALLASGCSQGPAPTARGENVVLVLIDELRKDAADAWLPRLNALSEKGIRFENMRSAAPWTYPSVISLMTGLYPQQHGARGDLRSNRLSSFAPDLPLLPGLLRASGYHTAAFVTNPFLQPFNPFHENFDHYDIGFVNDLGNIRAPGEMWSTPRMFADRVEKAVFAYFDERPVDGPEFTYVHLIDVHGPWDAAPFSPDYSSAVAFVDDRVAELYEYFTRRYQGKLIFVVTSDHGRATLEDLSVDEPGKQPLRVNKASMHEFNLRIPFMILPGAHVHGPRRVTRPSSNVDVVPTLLEWLGIEAPAQIAGVSLLPAIRGGAPDGDDRPIYFRNDSFGFWTDAMLWRKHKYIRYYKLNGDVAVRKTFDLETDPHELRGRRGRWDQAGPMLTDLGGSQGIEYQARFTESDPELVRQLQALGYMRGD